MTFKEQLIKEYPWLFAESIDTTIKEKCPSELGFISRAEEDKLCKEVKCDCKKCWNREMPNTEERDELKERLELIDELKQVEYNKGLNDAWELLSKLYDFTCDELLDIFDLKNGFYDVIRNYTPQEALAKLKAYEELIEVGDVVEAEEGIFVVSNIIKRTEATTYFGITRDGKLTYGEDVKKTGKHIDIKSILDSIGE